MLVDSVNIYKNNLTFEQAEVILKQAKKLSNAYYYVNETLANLYIEKGDSLQVIRRRAL